MPFLKNAWYAAAWEDEVAGTTLLSRRLLDEPVLLVRDEAGIAHALRDRCPHRFVPLSRGAHCGTSIQCGYHGLRFDFAGKCIENPHGNGAISPLAQVRAYPLVSRHLLLWIWMGDPERADPDRIPVFRSHDPERFAINRGYMHVGCNYEYMTDNIMDLGHIEFLHQGLLGSEAVRRAKTEMRQEGDTVHSNRLTHAEILPAPLDFLYESGGQPVDRWLDVRWDPPALMQLTVGVTPTGQPERVGKETPGVHLMTPETENTTHYFWSNGRDFRRDDAELHAQLDSGLRFAFEHQDKPMILAQHEALEGADFWDLRPLILEGDAGAVRARRIMKRLIHTEQTQEHETSAST